MRLYKYLHPDRLDVLRDGFIRFSSPKALNDPFELRPHVSALATESYLNAELDRSIPQILEEEYSKLPREARRRISFTKFKTLAQGKLSTAKSQVKDFSSTVGPMLQGIMARGFEEKIGLFCLTESQKNLLMWAHYADSHQGFVVEFDSDAPFFNQKIGPEDELRHLRKVTYSERRPSLILSESDSFSPFLTKSIEWKYEAEWRMILPLFQANRIIGEGPSGVHLFAYPRTSVRSVILGCRATEKTKDDLLEIVRTTDDLRDIHCYQVSIHEEHYDLQFSLIER